MHIRNNYLSRRHQLGLWEYILLASPDESVTEKVMREKEYFEQKFEAKTTTRTLPHISLATFLAREKMEDPLCRRIQKACDWQYSFTVALNNFSGFPCHAVYIRVQNSNAFDPLLNNLKGMNEILRFSGCPPLQIVHQLHITIARRLDDDVYNKAIKEYTHRNFHALFKLQKLTLLKRDSRYKKWQGVTCFYLPMRKNLFN